MKKPTLALALTLVASGCTETETIPPPFDAGAVDAGTPADRGVATDGARVDTGTPIDTGTPVDAGNPADVPSDAPSCTDPVAQGELTGTPWCDLPLPAVPGVTVPEGFCIRRYANVPTARVLAFAPNGDLFVASPSAGTPGGAPPGNGAIMVVTDDDHNGAGDTPRTFLSNVTDVHGLLFRRNALLYTTQSTVMSLAYCNGDRAATTTLDRHARVATLTGAVRWTHTLAESTDGRLMVSMGQYDISQCPAPDARAGSVLQIGAGMPEAGSTVVDGFRNPMYIRCKEWGACYAAELSGDGWDSIGGREKLIEIRQGDRYGFPCCVDRGMPTPGATAAGTCMDIASSVQTYPLHDTPFGFDWAPSSWPAPYNGSFFVGLHGWVGSWTNAGVQWAPVDPATHRPTRASEWFVRGFGRRTAGGNDQRVSDLVFARDGRMFFADDQSGDIYWVAPTTLRMPAR
jgi:glucose/arabinose dehydrogenase